MNPGTRSIPLPPPASAAVLLLVPSASHALKGETALHRAGITCALVPVPRAVSSQCGVCIRVNAAERARALETLTACQVEITATHDVQTKRSRKD